MRFARAAEPARPRLSGTDRFGLIARSARSEHGELLRQPRRTAMGTWRSFPVARPDQDLAVFLALLAMKFINRHAGRIIGIPQNSIIVWPGNLRFCWKTDRVRQSQKDVQRLNPLILTLSRRERGTAFVAFWSSEDSFWPPPRCDRSNESDSKRSAAERFSLSRGERAGVRGRDHSDAPRLAFGTARDHHWQETLAFGRVPATGN